MKRLSRVPSPRPVNDTAATPSPGRPGTRLKIDSLEDRSLPSAAGLSVPMDTDHDAGHGSFCPCPDCAGGNVPTAADEMAHAGEVDVAEAGHVHDEFCGHDSMVDVFGHEFYEEPPIEGGDGGGEEAAGDGSGDGSGEAGGTVPAFESRPEATRKLFLDFDGHVVEGTYWNSRNNGNPIHAPAYSRDSDTSTFSDADLTRIEEIWKRVAEDFAPFNVDVTTVDPGPAAFTEGGEALRVLISTDVDTATGNRWYSGAGGVAYLNSWYWTSDTPVWVFENNLGNGHAKYVAEAASHEAGHGFGLRHDGRTDPSEGYYRGHGSGDTGWASIMGVGYYKRLSQWSQGEYNNANNSEDDLARIAQAVGFATDDHGDSASGGTQLSPDADGNVAADGLIETRTDVDVFSFTTAAGPVSFDVTPFEGGTGYANLDILAEVYDANNTLIASANPADKLDASLDLDLAAGTYTLQIDGTGKGDPLGTGYTDYGSLGWYTVTGTVVPDSGNGDPTPQDDSATLDQDTSKVIDVLANDTDPDGDALTVVSAGSPSNGTAEVVNGGIRYTPAAGFFGYDEFTYTVEDTSGARASATVGVTVEQVAATLGETGTVTTDQQNRDVWHRVQFGNTYDSPVVVMGPATFNGGQATTVRVRNVTPTGFEFQMDEWVYLDGYHVTEDISWMVMEAGTHTLEDGTRVVAGTTGVNTGWKSVDVSAGGFNSRPAVFTQVASVNEADAVTTRVRNLTAGGFQVQLEEEEARGSHGNETVGYIAIESGGAVGFTGDVVKHDTNTAIGSASGYQTPVVLAGMVTTDGGDTSTLRRKVQNGQFVVNVHEEQSRDSETGHTTEDVAYYVADAGAFRGTSDD